MSKARHKLKKIIHNYNFEFSRSFLSWPLIICCISLFFGVGCSEIFNGSTQGEHLSPSSGQGVSEKKRNEEKESSQPILNYEELKSNQEMMKIGKEHFKSKCVACHGQEGQGRVGPNLTDNYWLHSKGDLEGVLRAIRMGFLGKGMVGWKDVIPENEQPYLAAYVLSLKGTSPPDPKGAQGSEVKK